MASNTETSKQRSRRSKIFRLTLFILLGLVQDMVPPNSTIWLVDQRQINP